MTNSENYLHKISNPGGRMTKWKGKAASMAPMALFATASVAALSVGMANADTISVIETSQHTFSTDADHSITATGGVVLTGGALGAVRITTNYSSNFVNDGIISIIDHGTDRGTGLSLNGDLLVGGSIINNGSVLVDIVTTANSNMHARGLYINGTVNGTLANNGTITVSAKQTGSNSNVYAYGISAFDVSATGRINNTGTINVTSFISSSSDIYAYGIYVLNNLAGEMNNSGTITVTATESSNSSASAYGAYVGGNLSGIIDNSGTIKVDALSTSSYAYGYGIYVSGDVALGGAITNSGTVDVKAKAYDTVHGYGVYVGGNVAGAIDNSGTIKVDVESTTYDQYGYGIYVSGSVTSDGSINNSGTIDVLAHATHSETGYAYGVKVDSGLNGSLTNSGTIRAYALTKSSTANAYGIYARSGLNGQITNSGTIDVKAVSESNNAYAKGIYVQGNVGAAGLIDNSGTINVEAHASTRSSATGYGIKVYSTLNGQINNSGTIDVKAFSTNSSGNAYGVHVRTVGVDGSINNSGTISATTDGGIAYGIYVDTLAGTLGNIGRVTATATSGAAYGIYLRSGTGTLNLKNTDQVTGLIRVNQHDVNLSSVANTSSYFAFEDANTGVGVYTATQNGGSPWFVSDAGGSNPIYATYDQSLVTGQELGVHQAVMLGGFLGELSTSVANGTASRNLVTVSTQNAASIKSYPFVQATYAHTTYKSSALTKSQVSSGAVQGGSLFELDAGSTVGFMLSGIESRTKSYTKSTGFLNNRTTGSGFGLDLAYSPSLSLGALTLGLGAGTITQDQQRFVAGITTTVANSRYNARWSGVSAEFSRSFNLGNDWALTPTGKVSLTTINFGAFAETGTAPTLATISSRTGNALAGEFGVKASKQLGGNGVVSAGLSYFATNWSGANGASVSLLGQTQTVNSVNQNVSGAVISLGIEQVSIGRGNLTVLTKMSFNQGGGVGLNASAKFEFKF